MNVFTEKDADLGNLKGKKVAVIGYGSQGHAHALNLRDSGIDVVVGLKRDSASCKKAEGAGLKVMPTAEAAAWGDVVMILVPDEMASEMYDSEIAPGMRSWLQSDGARVSTMMIRRFSSSACLTCAIGTSWPFGRSSACLPPGFTTTCCQAAEGSDREPAPFPTAAPFGAAERR